MRRVPVERAQSVMVQVLDKGRRYDDDREAGTRLAGLTDWQTGWCWIYISQQTQLSSFIVYNILIYSAEKNVYVGQNKIENN